MRIAIVDDHPGFRRVARDLLQAEGCEVVGVFATAEQALAELGTTPPEVVLVDVLLPGMDGFAAAPLIASAIPGTAVVLISSRPLEDLGADRVTAALARGFLAKAALSRAAVDAVLGRGRPEPRPA
jgi:DNA-binding NarL/FixJ family response regulator